MDFLDWVFILAFLCLAGGVIHVLLKERKKNKELKKIHDIFRRFK